MTSAPQNLKTLSRIVHASAVVHRGIGFLFTGRSAAGKSDLTLRVLDQGGSLIADDQVLLQEEKGKLLASAPTPIKGLVEIRGLGLFEFPHLDHFPLSYEVRLRGQGSLERLPETQENVSYLGVKLPIFYMTGRESSDLAKLNLLVNRAAQTPEEGVYRYQVI